MYHMRSHRYSAGFGLIEALIALVVTTVGLLAVATLLTKSLQYSHSSYQRSVAVSQAVDLSERMWAGACALDTSLNSIVSGWKNDHQVTQGMAQWAATVTSDTSVTPARYTIDIKWEDDRFQRTGADAYSFSYVISVPEFPCS